MDQAALPQRPGQTLLDGAISPAAPSEMTSSGQASPRSPSSVRKSSQASADSAAAGGQPDEHRLAVGGRCPTRPAPVRPRAPACILKIRRVQEQVVQLDVVQAPGRSTPRTRLDRLADPRHRRLATSPPRSPSASASVASTSRIDSPRTNPAITSDSSALVLVTCVPNSREANGSVVPRSFGRCNGHRPGGGLDRRRAVAVARPGRRVLAAAARW